MTQQSLLTLWGKRIFILLICSFITILTNAQERKWDGEAGDSAWSNPLNWAGNQLPSPTDSVLLDNSFLSGNYVVKLPSGTTTVILHHLIVLPDSGRVIELFLPPASTVVPAFSTSGKGGLKLYDGALFRNASGASSGTPITLTDSIYIYNGGRFIQQTSTAHASIVTLLSKSAGTETGTFEFDVPGHASYTVSITGRNYGNLQFSSTAAGGSKTYLSTGSSAAKIRGQLTIGLGVNFNLNYSGSLTIEKDLILMGNWNLSTGTLSPTVYLKGLFQLNGELTESGSGNPILELAGSRVQEWEQGGNIKNNVIVRLNNSYGVRLRSAVMLPYKLQLLQGKLFTSWTELLTMGENGWVEADSIVGQAYIKGPVRKMGLKNLSGFYFPVGGPDCMRWMGVSAASGNLAVEYVAEPAKSIPGVLTGGLARVSQKEHWKLRVDSFLLGTLELSFRPPYSGAISDFGSLTVALNRQGVWNNLGHASNTGLINGSGTVKSILYENFDTGYQYCSLAGELLSENLLPLHKIALTGKKEGYWLQLYWSSEEESLIENWELQSADSRGNFSSIYTSPASGMRQYKLPAPFQPVLFRIKALHQNGEIYYSNVWKSGALLQKWEGLKKITSLPGALHLDMELLQAGLFEFQLFTAMGKRIGSLVKFVSAGESTCILPFHFNEHGVFVLKCNGANGLKFTKQFLY